VAGSFLDLLYDEAPRATFDEVVAAAERSGATPAELAEVRRQYDLALRLRELIARQRAAMVEARRGWKKAWKAASNKKLRAWMS